MCGICGIAGLGKNEHSAGMIRRMNLAIQHRGPDSEGFYENEGIAFGHRRLSIIDLSTLANQPFKDHSGRYVLIFNGEIYNFREIRKQIPEYRFVTSSDTEVILAAYIKWGARCLEKFRGMFTIAIWDNQEEKLFIARDRFGVKPLYYHFRDGILLFSSEIRALLASNIIPGKLNRQALVDYLKYQSVITPYTLVEGILQLPAGHSLEFHHHQISIQPYWDITNAPIATHSVQKEQVHGKIRELLFQSIERRLISDVPIGAFLSGGIDSSAVVAIMAQVSEKKPMAFTVGFEEKQYDESVYAELIAKKYGIEHKKVILKPDDFLHELPVALQAMDTPSGDGINTFVVSKAIKQSGITVALSGIGGDELFAGYPIFSQFRKLHGWQKFYSATRLGRSLVASLIPAGNQKNERIKAILSAKKTDISLIYPLLRQIQTREQIDKVISFTERENEKGTLESFLESRQPALEKFDALGQVSIADYWGYTQHVLLKDTDQMSMAVSLEVREPFFDQDLVEYVIGLPDAFKETTYPKKLLVDSIKPLIPDEVVFRKKQGFVLPYDVWLRNELRQFCDQKIKNLSARVHFNGAYLSEYWDRFLKGRSNIRWTDIWILIVLENWLEQNRIE